MGMLEDLQARLQHEGEKEDAVFKFDVEPVSGPVAVLQVMVKDRDGLPLFLSISGVQLISIAHLFREEDVIDEKRESMWQRMLELNIPMPLSSYGKMGDIYVVFGAMAVDSSIEEMILELQTLNDNALEAFEAMREFLKVQSNQVE